MCLLCKEGLSYLNLNVFACQLEMPLSLKYFFTYPPFPLASQPALTSDFAQGLSEIWRC